MSSKNLNALRGLEREGDPCSKHNRKVRRWAAAIIDAVCDNYPLPYHCKGDVIMELPRDYRIIYHSGTRPPWKEFVAEDNESILDSCHYGHDGVAISLAMARRIAHDVWRGWLDEVRYNISHTTQGDPDGFIDKLNEALGLASREKVASK